MIGAFIRFVSALLWPLTVWFSLTQLESHGADDYVERTSPIVATAIAFWVCAASLWVLANPSVVAVSGGILGEDAAVALVRRAPGVIVDVLWFFVPALYAIGFWLFAARDEAFHRSA